VYAASGHAESFDVTFCVISIKPFPFIQKCVRPHDPGKACFRRSGRPLDVRRVARPGLTFTISGLAGQGKAAIEFPDTGNGVMVCLRPGAGRNNGQKINGKFNKGCRQWCWTTWTVNTRALTGRIQMWCKPSAKTEIRLLKRHAQNLVSVLRAGEESGNPQA
jgi:hypothetical protein